MLTGLSLGILRTRGKLIDPHTKGKEAARSLIKERGKATDAVHDTRTVARGNRVGQSKLSD